MTKKSKAIRNVAKKATSAFEAVAHEYVLNAMTMRQDWIRRIADPRRDVDEECRYPVSITAYDYHKLYKRFGIAKRVVNLEPSESWQLKPEIYDSEDSDETEFELKWKKINERFRIINYMKKADGLSGVGHFGLLLLGINDGQLLSKPVKGVPTSGVLEEGYKVKRQPTELLFIRVFDESMANVSRWDNDTSSPRFGQPIEYVLNLLSPDDLRVESLQPGNGQDTKVHWTRVIHLARNRTSSEVYGDPEMEDVYNHLIDLKKILGAGAEGYWQGAFPGLSFETQKDLENFDLDIPNLKKEARKYFDGLQRYIATVGMNVKSLAPNVQDPVAQFETAIKAICTAKGIPYRTFMGTEEGKLAGGQDKDSWKDRMTCRREDYLTPEVIRPVIDRLIMLNILPIPLEQQYMIDWPDMYAPTEMEIATTAQAMTEAMAKYVQGGVDEMITPEDYLIQVLKFDPQVVKTFMDNAVQRVSDINAGVKDIPLSSPTPDEIRAQEQQKFQQKDTQRQIKDLKKMGVKKVPKGLAKNEMKKSLLRLWIQNFNWKVAAKGYKNAA